MARAAKKEVPLLEPEEYAAQSSTAVVRCRANQHYWPRLDPDEPVPGNVTVYKLPDGFVQVIFTCNDCGRIVDYLLNPGAVLGDFVDRRYRKPKSGNWIVVPRAAGMSKIDWQRNFYARCADTLLAAAIPLPDDD